MTDARSGSVRVCRVVSEPCIEASLVGNFNATKESN